MFVHLQDSLRRSEDRSEVKHQLLVTYNSFQIFRLLPYRFSPPFFFFFLDFFPICSLKQLQELFRFQVEFVHTGTFFTRLTS